jgi:hypothetical protein
VPDVKLTGLKLLDAWYHKGPSKLRLDIDFQPARVLRLPTKSFAQDNEVTFVNESRLLKKRHSEGSETSPQKRQSVDQRQRLGQQHVVET